jgi:hypothetical protein
MWLFQNLTHSSEILDYKPIIKVVGIVFFFLMTLVPLNSDEQLGRNHQNSVDVPGFFYAQ